MITRPLDLSSKLRPAPRSMDAFFYVNVVLLGLFFVLFGSRFVMSPGIELLRPEFSLPESSGGASMATNTTAVISVLGPNMVFTSEGRMSFSELAAWLPSQVARGGEDESRLLVRADTRVPASDLLRLSDIATAAGFSGVHLALERERGTDYSGGRQQ
jgi:biopolymer transport protein ExbD